MQNFYFIATLANATAPAARLTCWAADAAEAYVAAVLTLSRGRLNFSALQKVTAGQYDDRRRAGVPVWADVDAIEDLKTANLSVPVNG